MEKIFFYNINMYNGLFEIKNNIFHEKIDYFYISYASSKSLTYLSDFDLYKVNLKNQQSILLLY